MAETRKHRVTPRDELDQALFAALGEPVRPAVPGEPSAASGPADEASEPAAPVTAPIVAPGTALGSFTFGRPR